MLYVTATVKVQSSHRLILNLGIDLMASGQQRPVQVRQRRMNPVAVSARPLSGSSLCHIPNKFKDHKQIACQATETWITLRHFGTSRMDPTSYFWYKWDTRRPRVLMAMLEGRQHRCVLLERANNAPMPQTSSGSKLAAGDCELCTERRGHFRSD